MTPEFWTLVGQFGFPMVISGYLLVRMDSTIKDLSNVIAKNTVVLSQIAGREGIKGE